MDLTAKALHARVRFVVEAAFLVLSQKASEKLLDESGVVAGRQRAHIKTEEKCVCELEIRKFRIEHGVGEQAVTPLLVAARNDTNILEILGAPVRVIYPGNDLQKCRDNRRRDADGYFSRKIS